MFGRKQASNKPQTQNRIDSLIGDGTVIQGHITFTGGLRIDGKVEGDIKARTGESSTLVLSEKAEVTGTLQVSHLIINGQQTGTVYANEYVELQSKAHIVGDVHYKTMEMHPGAVIEGKLIHSLEGAPEAPALLPSTTQKED